jgi:spore maturation protein CgeB
MKIFLAGNFNTYTLETSYKNALIDEGYEVRTFDFPTVTRKYIRFGKVGHLLHNFLPVQAWIRKVNRELVIEAKNFRPNLLFVFTNTPVLPSSLAFLKSILPIKCILIWPDTVFNLQSHVLSSALMYDFVASYSSNCCKTFSELGFKKVEWIPLAADPNLHYASGSVEKIYDLTFVGGWRPEREEALAAIVKHFPSSKLKIWGPYWKRSKNKAIHPHITEKPLYGKEFTKIVQNSLINMNIIDETNYPAANMRFFEIPVAGGLQLASACPEMESIYRHNETIMYFHNKEELLTQVEYVLSNREKSLQIAKNSQEFTLAAHTYKHRTQQIIELLNK